MISRRADEEGIGTRVTLPKVGRDQKPHNLQEDTPMPSNHRLFAPFAMLAAITLGACSQETDSDGPPPASIQPALVAEAGSIRDVSVEEASALVSGDSPVTVLDVRTPGEFEAGHIEGAINVDVMSETFIEDLARLDKDTTYVLHCKSGARSARALEAMKAAEFGNVAHMTGGFDAWTSAGLPVAQ